MIAYFDTSALIPLIIDEPMSAPAAELWGMAPRVVSVRLLYPEARAALAQARRLRRITERQLEYALRSLESLDDQIDHIEVTAVLARRAGELAQMAALRGYDAVHLAAAESIADEHLVVVAADNALRSAAHTIGMATATLP